jgi:hypothetical protein
LVLKLINLLKSCSLHQDHDYSHGSGCSTFTLATRLWPLLVEVARLLNVQLDVPPPGAPTKLRATPRDVLVLQRAAELIVQEPPNQLRAALAIAAYLAVENNSVRYYNN